MQEIEIWTPVRDYDGLYEVSNLGNVKSLRFGKERILKPALNRHNYLFVILTNSVGKTKSHRIHRLVWEAFNHKTDLYIDHISEGDKLDNRLVNLQAVTQRENVSKYHSTTNKYSKYTGVTWSKMHNIWIARIRVGDKPIHIGNFDSELEASIEYQKALDECIATGNYVPKRKVKYSQFKGVSFNKNQKKWTSIGTINKKKVFLGHFDTELEAHNAYQQSLKTK